MDGGWDKDETYVSKDTKTGETINAEVYWEEDSEEEWSEESESEDEEDLDRSARVADPAIAETELIRLRKMFPVWAEADSKIANFLHNLDINHEYSEQEIVSAGLRPRNLTTPRVRGNNNSNGQILHKGENGWHLHSDLVDLYRKYF